MILYKEDLKKIGHTKAPTEDGKYLTILCNPDTANIEEILLRNILPLFGDYKIVESKDFWWKEPFDVDNLDIEFVTDFPWEEYRKL